MDTFFEQIIVKKPRQLEKTMKICTYILAVVSIITMLYFTILFVGTFFSGLFLILAFGVGYGLYFISKRTYIEYEYSITNGDFDIDRIIGKSKRERLISTSCSKFQEFGIYNESIIGKFSQREFGAKINAANQDNEKTFFAVVPHKDAGLVLIIFQPNDKLQLALSKFVPRMVQNNVFSRD